MAGNTVAKIALQAATYAIDKPYDYQVPEELTAARASLPRKFPTIRESAVL